MANKLSEESIKEIKSIIEDKGVDFEEDDKKGLKTMRQKSHTNSIELGSLFLTGYNYLNSCTYYFEKGKILNELKKLLEVDFFEKLRNALEEYDDGKNIGSYEAGEKIRDIVRSEFPKMEELIEIFFKIFVED